LVFLPRRRGSDPFSDRLNRQQISQLVDDGEASHALVIQQGFSSGNLAGEDAGLLLIRDPGRSMEDQMIQISMLQALFVSRTSNWWIDSLAEQLEQAGMEENDLEQFKASSSLMGSVIDRFRQPDIADEPVTEETPVQNPESATENEQNTQSWMTRMLPLATEERSPPARPKQATYQMAQAVAGMSVMMLMFGLTSCGRTLLQQRDAGTLSRLLTLGVSRGEFTVGYGIVYCWCRSHANDCAVYLWRNLVWRRSVSRSIDVGSADIDVGVDSNKLWNADRNGREIRETGRYACHNPDYLDGRIGRMLVSSADARPPYAA
jgi:hypothetical protein